MNILTLYDKGGIICITFFSERFYKLRKEYNYTQYKLGKLLNISRSTISKYESGDLFPATHTLIKIARVFKVSVDYLIGLSDER